MFGANGIVGGGMPIASARRSPATRGNDNVTRDFFGDGAVDEGDFYEALNIAAAWELPIVFLCENNQYAANIVSGPRTPRRHLGPSGRKRSASPASPLTA